ncbi:MAG TPA: hypothetical protein VEB19_05470 [Gemmatimonadaceae bacterium]|nr:hypothetical protein [Gemmatimonadaceae bacterium]
MIGIRRAAGDSIGLSAAVARLLHVPVVDGDIPHCESAIAVPKQPGRGSHMGVRWSPDSTGGGVLIMNSQCYLDGDPTMQGTIVRLKRDWRVEEGGFHGVDHFLIEWGTFMKTLEVRYQ